MLRAVFITADVYLLTKINYYFSNIASVVTK